MKSIAIEREFGSGGREVGKLLAEKAGMAYYDGELLVQAAERFGFSLDELKEFDEQRTGSLLYSIAMYANYNQDIRARNSYGLLHGIRETVRRLALQEPCVFIGRGSTEILRQEHLGYGVYVYCSDMDKRLRRIMETEDVSEQDAKRLLERKDRDRKNYFKVSTEKNWADRKNYDMELNMAGLTAEQATEAILALLKDRK